MILRPGKGQITVNKRPFEDYFVSESARAYVRQPLLATETADKFDLLILADGGGITGQMPAAYILALNCNIFALPLAISLMCRDAARFMFLGIFSSFCVYHHGSSLASCPSPSLEA